MVRVDAEDLRPAFSACIFEVEVDICKSLVHLGVDLFVVYAGLGMPTAYEGKFILDLWSPGE
jgi:hypothetical protein